MKKEIAKKYLAAAVGLLMAAFYGCGSGDYEARLDARIRELKSASKYNILSPTMDVPDTSVSIRIPQLNESNRDLFIKTYGNPPSVTGFEQNPLKEGEVDPRRSKTNVVNLVDIRAVYEGYVEDKNEGKQHYYLYVAVSSGQMTKYIPRNLQSELGVKFNNTTQLANYQAKTPEDRDVSWQEFHGSGNQIFYYLTKNNDAQYPSMPGVVYILFHEENDLLITLVWRYPTGLEQNIDFQSWIKLVAGCVNVKG
jgi:hypothetical protein